MTTTTQRPPEFDARVMAYLPGLRKLARRYRGGSEARNDLVTDTIMRALEKWERFREDGDFWNFLIWTMRDVVSGQAQHRARRLGLQLVSNDVKYMNASTPAQQLGFSELSDAIRRLPAGREGVVILRRAMGDELQEIGADFGVSAERVRQIETRARGVVRRRMGMKVAA